MNLKEQVQSQVSYAQTHKGKAIGSVVGLIAGVSYGLAGKKDNWMVSGLAIAGVVAGAILGGMFDKQPAVIVPVPVDGDKTPINDTAGEEGVMNASGVIASPSTRNCYCSPASTAPDYTNVNNLQHCQQLCGGAAGVSYGGNRRTKATSRR